MGPAIFEEALRPLDKPKGERMAVAEGSPGEVLAVGEVECCWPAPPWAKLPIVKCSDLAVDIMDYVIRPSSEMVAVE